MRGLVLVLPVVLVACRPLLAPAPQQPTAKRELRKLLNFPPGRVRNAVAAALAGAGFSLEAADTTGRRLRTRPRRYPLTRANTARLRQIADLEPARRRGLRRLAEYWVEYEASVEPAGESATVLAIESRIQVVDRSQGLYLGTGIVQTMPQYYSVPSRGVLERELFTTIGSDLYSAEEMLFRTGIIGRD